MVGGGGGQQLLIHLYVPFGPSIVVVVVVVVVLVHLPVVSGTVFVGRTRRSAWRVAAIVFTKYTIPGDNGG